MGAPSGVPPTKIAMYRAITRPRITGSVVVCTMLFAVVMNVIDVRPTSTREIAKVVNVGITAEIAQATPKAAAEIKTTRICGFSRRAERSAPVTEPIASTEESRPNSPAP